MGRRRFGRIATFVEPVRMVALRGMVSPVWVRYVPMYGPFRRAFFVTVVRRFVIVKPFCEHCYMAAESLRVSIVDDFVFAIPTHI